MSNGMSKKTMFWNWLRWQCLNTKPWNDGEIPAGTMIDDDQAMLQVMKLMRIKGRKHG